jgi:hypothetical protein
MRRLRKVFVRRDDLEQLRQGDQHEPEPYGDAADVARSRSSGPEHCYAGEQEQGGQTRNVEREGLDDKGGAYVRAEHHRKRRDKRDEAAGRERGDHQTRRSAALKNGSHA